jgi:hypothetical protein
MVVFLCLILLAAAWVAIPLLPAILIYRIFPHEPFRAQGTLAGTGLKINAGGAAGAYLVVLLIIMPLAHKAEKRIGGLDKSYWDITAVARFVDDTGKEIEPPPDLINDMDLKAAPSNLSHNDSTLTLKIPEEIARSFPRVRISFPHNPEWTGVLDLSATRIPWWKFWSYSDQNATVDPLFKEMDFHKISVHRTGRPPRTYNNRTGMDRPGENIF